jgi:hypothetical protein
MISEGAPAVKRGAVNSALHCFSLGLGLSLRRAWRLGARGAELARWCPRRVVGGLWCRRAEQALGEGEAAKIDREHPVPPSRFGNRY